jgi:hypothetical protein
VDIITVVQAVLRRWYISIPILAAATVAAFLIQSNAPPVYQAQGQLLLADPTLDPSGLPASAVDVDALLRQLDSDAVRAALEVDDAVYTVEAEDRTTLTVVVRASEEAAAESTALAIRGWMQDEVDGVQEEAGFSEEERLQVRGGERVTISSDPVADSAQAVSTITLFDPTAGIVNPFAPSLATARLLIVAVEADESRLAVLEQTGPGTGFLLSQSPRDAAPIMGVTTTGGDPNRVIDAFEVVAQQVDAELQARQERAEIPTSRRTRVETLAAPGRATDISPPVERAAGAIFGLGGLLALSTAVAADSMLARRRGRSLEPWPPEDASLPHPADPPARFEGPRGDSPPPAGTAAEPEQGAVDRR